MRELQFVAIAGVAVDDHRDAHRVAHGTGQREVLGHGDDAGVRQRVRGGDLEAAGPDSLEAGALGHLRAQRIMGADEADDLRTRQAMAQSARSFGHEGLLFPVRDLATLDGKLPAHFILKPVLLCRVPINSLESCRVGGETPPGQPARTPAFHPSRAYRPAFRNSVER